MCPSKHLTPTLALIAFLAAACSAGKSGSGKDAAADGKATTTDAQVDEKGSVDVAARDVALGVRDAAAETSDAAVAKDTAFLPDVAIDKSGAEVGDVRIAVRDSSSDSDSEGETGALPDAGKDLAVNAKDAAADTLNPDSRLDAPPPPNSCANPIDIPLDSPFANLVLSTTGESHKFDIPCAQGGPDLVLRFALSENSAVYADTFGATWNTALYISTTCPSTSSGDNPDAGSPACSDDACNTTQSQAFAILPNQVYYLILTGAKGESGDVTLHFQHAGLGTGLVAGLGSGTGSVSGTTITHTRGPLDTCEGAGPAASYWWVTCPDYLGGALTASTCTGTTFNTVLALQIPRTSLLVCNGDNYATCVERSQISTAVPPGAGLHALTVEGNTTGDFGQYLITYSVP